MSKSENQLSIRGRAIRVDDDGLTCLNDIWTAAGFTKNQRPGDWVRLPTTLRRIEAVLKLITGKSRNYTKPDILRALRTKRGADGGTYADVRLALDYAEYLNPALAIEVKEVFLRYKASDPTLADEVLQKASSEANRWVAVRAMSRIQRRHFTDALQQSKVTRRGYIDCTEAVYMSLLGGRAKQLKRKMDVPEKSSLRDALPIDQLSYVMAAEGLSAERIIDEGRQGDRECVEASTIGGSAIRAAIESDRRNRQKKLV